VGIIAEQGLKLLEEINLAPEKEEIYAVDTIDNEANLGSLSSKVLLQNPKSSGIFSLTHATRSLRGGVWFSGVPLEFNNSHSIDLTCLHGKGELRKYAQLFS
jgi:hypothetical protein